MKICVVTSYFKLEIRVSQFLYTRMGTIEWGYFCWFSTLSPEVFSGFCSFTLSSKANKLNTDMIIFDQWLKFLCSLPYKQSISRVQRWHSGESTRLLTLLPRFDSQIPRHMLVEFVGSLLCTERFSPGTMVSPLLKNQHFTWFVLIVNFIVLKAIS